MTAHGNDKLHLLPPPPTGVHTWLFGRAFYLRREGLSPEAAFTELRRHVCAATFREGRTVSDREIVDAITGAYKATKIPAMKTLLADYDQVAGWPAEMPLPRGEIKHERLKSVLTAAGNFELVDLWSSASVRPPDHPTPRWALTQLFGEDDVLCIGISSADFIAKPLRDWSDDELVKRQLIVPNPLRKNVGRTKTGTESAHNRDATGRRRYVIVESDAELDADQQAKILEYLRTVTKARLAAVVLSGGKSVHGWFRCDGVPFTQLHQWFSYAVTLGADPRLWLPEQFVRLPDGLRDTGARQSLVYLNPSA